MNVISYQYYKTKIGELILGSFEKNLCILDFRYRKMRESVDKRIKNGLNADFYEQSCTTVDLAKDQIDEYQ